MPRHGPKGDPHMLKGMPPKKKDMDRMHAEMPMRGGKAHMEKMPRRKGR